MMADEQQEAVDPEQGMREAAEMLNSAALAMKRRRCLVSADEVPGFVRTVYTLLGVCNREIIAWSEEGTQIVIRDSERFASEVCPKFFRHRNFNSFTRLLNMYQFHKVPTSRDSKEVCFEHTHFRRGREDLLPFVQRKGAQIMRDELISRELYERNFIDQRLGFSHVVAAAHAHARQQQIIMAQQQQLAIPTAPPPMNNALNVVNHRGGAAAAPSNNNNNNNGENNMVASDVDADDDDDAKDKTGASPPKRTNETALHKDAPQEEQQPHSAAASSEQRTRQVATSQLASSLRPMHPGAVDPAGWMRDMALLETEVRALKYENDRLKSLEQEKETLAAQIAAQADLIAALQAQSSFLTNCQPEEPKVDDVATAGALPEPLPDFNSPEFQALIQSVGGPVGAIAMMFSIFGGQLPQQPLGAPVPGAGDDKLAVDKNSKHNIAPAKQQLDPAEEPPLKKSRTVTSSSDTLSSE